MSSKKLQILGSFNVKDADTLDGKHANEFATAVDIEALNNLIGDTSVSDQIIAALATNHSYFLTTYTSINGETYTADHTYAEQRQAFESGKILLATCNRGIYHLIANGSEDFYYSSEQGVGIDGSIESKRFRHSSNNTIVFHNEIVTVNDFIVNITQVDDTTATVDKTYEEIDKAYNEGRTIYAIVSGSIILRMMTPPIGNCTTFGTTVPVNGSISYIIVGIYSGGTITYDRGEMPIPTKTSQLTNDSGFLTSAPVASVNGQTGAVNIEIPEAITVDTSLSTSSTNPVQNKVVKSALDAKVPTTRKVNGKALSADVSLSIGDLSAGYLNTHPENGPTIIPFINNDLAFLSKRGGSYEVYSTTSTDYTVASLQKGTLTISNPDNMFDGTPSYAMISTTGEFTAIIDMTLHKTFSYSNKFYIDFGANGWRAKNISVYAMNSATETAYIKKDSITGNTLGNWFANVSHTSTNESGTTVQGFNKLRVVLSGFNNTSSTGGKRISQVGLINYGSAGVSETFISRGGCSGIYGSLIPQSNGAINLGSSSNKWNSVYANKFEGTASIANKIGTTTVGSATKPVYINSGTPTACSLEIPTDTHINSLIDAKLAAIPVGDEVSY